jgi:polysaccharide export outer membrane protein
MSGRGPRVRRYVVAAFRHWCLAGLFVGWITCIVTATQEDYIIGAQDILTITVWNDPPLSGKYSVETDGSFTFPLLGRIKAGGGTLRDAEAEIRKRLADGFLKDPQVSVAVQEYRSQLIFVMGEVRQPGTHVLSGSMTLLEALARAGSTTERAALEVIVVRPSGTATPSAALIPGSEGVSEMIRVQLQELQTGALAGNVPLRAGDTVFVPRADKVYVFGQVKLPGEYVMSSATTVLQALSMAGGLTDRGSTRRIKIVRMIEGQKKELKVQLEELVRPGDTIIVGDRVF